MRFALIDKRRVEACPGLTGLCPNCGQKVIAKCGSQRIHHWAHYNVIVGGNRKQSGIVYGKIAFPQSGKR